MEVLQAAKEEAHGPAWQAENDIGLPDSALLAWLHERTRTEEAFLSLPCSLVMVFVFMLIVVGHMGQKYIFEIETGLRMYIHDNANWAFLDNGIVQNSPFGFKTIDDVYTI